MVVLKNGTLREKINHALDVFDSYQMTEKQQMSVVLNGIDFAFTWGDPDPTNRNRKLDCFEAAEFLETCRDMGLVIDINDLLEHSCDPKYEKLLGVIEVTQDFKSKARQKKS